jgi:quinol monooxygenase YgiN
MPCRHCVRRLLVVLALALLAGPLAWAEDKDDPIVAQVKARLKDASKPFALLINMQVKEGAGPKFEAAFAKALAATRKEPGCLAYDLNRDTQEPQRYVIYERWKGLDDLRAHLKSAHLKALREILPEVSAGRGEVRILVQAGE